MSIKNQLIITIICAVILPLLVVTLLVSQQIRSQAVEDFEQRATAEIQHVNTAFTLYLNSLAEDAVFFWLAVPLFRPSPKKQQPIWALARE